jgi:transposase-like protein
MTSRMKFTREFKLATVERLRAGEPLGSVARSLEVNRQELYRWKRKVKRLGEHAFPGVGRKRGRRAGSPSWNVRSGHRCWRSIF